MLVAKGYLHRCANPFRIMTKHIIPMLTKNGPNTILSVTMINTDDKGARPIRQSRNGAVTYLQSV